MSSLIEVARSDGIYRITLNRPPVNVFNSSMLDEFRAAIEHARDARVVVIAARGKAFCAGVDVGEHMPDRVASMLQRFHETARALLALESPTVAAVQGAALGGGCEIVTLCDFVVASDAASFGQPEIKLASFPPVAAAVLARVTGLRQAMSLILLGETLTAGAAQAAGLVTTVVDAGGLDEAVGDLVARLEQLSAPALRAAKRAALHGFRRAFEEGLEAAEHLYLHELIETVDAREGITAFLEKRPPVWRHR